MSEATTALVTAAPIFARAAARAQAGVAADEHDHEAEDLGLEQAVDDVLRLHETLEGGEVSLAVDGDEVRVLADERAAIPAAEVGDDGEDGIITRSRPGAAARACARAGCSWSRAHRPPGRPFIEASSAVMAEPTRPVDEDGDHHRPELAGHGEADERADELLGAEILHACTRSAARARCR